MLSNILGHVRSSALIAALILALPASAVVEAQTTAGNSGISTRVEVPTRSGPIVGKLDSQHDVRVFLGIPYAAPPVGPLRWKPPMPPAGWVTPRPAQSFGARCMQAPLFDDMVFRDDGPSKDCLTLNV